MGAVSLPRGHMADIFSCHNVLGGATGIQWVETRDATQHSTVHSTAPHTKNRT